MQKKSDEMHKTLTNLRNQSIYLYDLRRIVRQKEYGLRIFCRLENFNSYDLL